MTVTVTPEQFNFVYFDAAVIADVATALLEKLGLADRDLHIEVDETTPIAKVTVDIGEGAITVHAESGAFEDTKRPRFMSERAIATNLGRALLRVRDRLDGTFGEAPPDDDLSLPQLASWETYCVGRLERLGYEVHRQRWLYNFRNRHGFTDTTDAAFDELWGAERLTWNELEAISQRALAARQPA